MNNSEAVTDRAALLRSIPLFQALDDEDLLDLATQATSRPYKAGQLILNQGDIGHEMYIVSQGDVNIHLPGQESRRISLKDLSRGEYFGELALFDDKPRSASVMATTDAILIELTRKTLSASMERHPRAGMAILKTMSQRLRETNAMLSAHVAKNAVKEVEERLGWTDRLADKMAELNGSWFFILGLLGSTLLWALANNPRILGGSFDVYPFVFFNLLLAVLSALQGPLIMMSQNRQSLKDRAQSETDFQVNLKNEVNIETIMRELGEFRAESNRRLQKLETRGPSA